MMATTAMLAIVYPNNHFTIQSYMYTIAQHWRLF